MIDNNGVYGTLVTLWRDSLQHNKYFKTQGVAPCAKTAPFINNYTVQKRYGISRRITGLPREIKEQRHLYYYVYVLKSEIDHNHYVGYTQNLKERLYNHNEGKIKSTKNRKPFILIYFEGCLNQQDATKREKYLKTAWGKRYIKTRLNNYLTG